jgi:spore coat protein H
MRNRFLLGLTTFLLSALLVGPNLSLSQSGQADDKAKAIFGLGNLHKLNISMTKAEWDELQTSSLRGGTVGAAGADYTRPDGRIVHVGSGFRGYYPWIHADLTTPVGEVKDVGLRYKGNLSFSSSAAGAPLRANFKLKTDIYGTKDDWSGLETLNFHAGVLDPSLMREAMGYYLFRAAGVPSPRTAYVEINFNVPGFNIPGALPNSSGGMYLLIENVNKQFLKWALPPGTGLLLKPEGLRGGIGGRGDTWSAYTPTWRPDRDATPDEQKKVMEFANLVSQPDLALFKEKIDSYLDVDKFLRFIAINAFLLNWDGYLTGGHNFYVYLDPKDDKIRFLPWDLDLSLGARGGPANAANLMRPANAQNLLVTRLLDDPATAEKYRLVVKELATTILTREELEKILVELEKVRGSRDAALRSMIDSRVAYVQSLRSEWDK